MENNSSIINNQQNENGSTNEELDNEKAPLIVTSEETTTATESTPKKPPGSGPIPITMDVYHQLQQKRLLERQQQQQQQQQEQPKSSEESSKSEHSSQSVFSTQVSAASQPSLNALEQIVNIVQATVPALPLQTQPQQIQMPGPDLANIIFGHAPSLGHTSESDTGYPTNPSKPIAAAVDGHSGHNTNQHRKSAGGAGSHPNTSAALQSSQPRTTSPPTPVAGTSSSVHKNTNAKGQKAIHAIELIRIAAEILQL